MSVVCLIATWRDGSLLGEAVASARPHVAAVVVLDGGYAGVVDPDRASSRPAELELARQLGALVPTYRGLWRSEPDKRTALLELGRIALAERGARRPWWALVLDADERLVDGRELAPALDGWEGLTLPVSRREPDGSVWSAPSRCFRLTAGVCYGRRSDELIYEDGCVSIAHSPFAVVGMPLIEHRWHERPDWRLDVRRRHELWLAGLDAAASARL